MKGIILAGGLGKRLRPLTYVTNKHLLPIYNYPMIFYPLSTLLKAGIKDILLISGPEHAEGFLKLLGSGKKLKCKFTFEVQEKAGGIAQALGLAKNFVGKDNCCVILGDNIFEDNLRPVIQKFKEGACVFLKRVKHPERFGVPAIKSRKILRIEEKPKKPKSSYAITGLYLYDSSVFKIIKTLKPSRRGELEITDVNNAYLKQNQLDYQIIKGYWTDAGTFESLHAANQFVQRKTLRGKPLVKIAL